eukprot:GHVR01015106.1.p2 GENE.GHVR01015106.1~~GHVR01015106.1.p2  ORF type:complete len:120 (+),score=118.39 GHVR01015106.1:498-857(+)
MPHTHTPVNKLIGSTHDKSCNTFITHAHTHTHTDTHTHTPVVECLSKGIQTEQTFRWGDKIFNITYKHTHIHNEIHANTHTNTHIHTHTAVNELSPRVVKADVDTHTHTHTHTHTRTKI